MAIDLTNLAGITTEIRSLSNLALVSVNENRGYQAQKEGSSAVLSSAPKFLFHYEKQNNVSFESEITDHYIESNNTVVNDQIALKPEIISVQGFIGELNNVIEDRAQPFLNEAEEKLSVLSAFNPSLSSSALRTLNQAAQIYQTGQALLEAAQSSAQTISNFLGEGNEETIRQNKQQIAFSQFYGYWQKKTLFKVQTPWAIFPDMVIQSLKAIQDDVLDLTTFDISFKRLRFANSSIINVTSPENASGRLKSQIPDEINLGTSTPILSIPISSRF